MAICAAAPNETRKEPPLGQVQREAYVWYQKGSLVFYALSDYIGEDKLNLALHNFLMQYRYANANDAQSGPYPDTRLMEDALRAQTPADLQYFIDDSFEKITLYDNKAVEATSQKMPDGKYKVTLTVQGGKAYADGNGVESPAPLHDLIDVGVFSGKKDEEKPLALRKEWITGAPQTLRVRGEGTAYARRHRPLTTNSSTAMGMTTLIDVTNR